MFLAEGTSRFRGRQRTGRTIARLGTKSREEEWTSAPATQETSETLAPQVWPTQLDKIKNLRVEVHPSGVTETDSKTRTFRLRFVWEYN